MSKDASLASLQSQSDSRQKQLNALSFKLEVLLDLLAAASADEKKASESAEKDRRRADEYRRELERVYTLAAEKGVDIDLRVNMRDD